MLDFFFKIPPTKNDTGFSLIEVLIVVAILTLLLLAALMSFTSQRLKAEDAKIKADLEKLRIAFEDYYNDNNCYPPEEFFDGADDCGSSALAPYLNTIPCNPKSGMPYILEYVGGQCDGFRLYTTLNLSQDPNAQALCTSSGGSLLGNYGVSSSNTTVRIACEDPGSSPTPTPTPGTYGCQWSTEPSGRICQNVGYPNDCPISFNNIDICDAYCPTAPQSMSCN